MAAVVVGWAGWEVEECIPHLTTPCFGATVVEAMEAPEDVLLQALDTIPWVLATDLRMAKGDLGSLVEEAG